MEATKAGGGWSCCSRRFQRQCCRAGRHSFLPWSPPTRPASPCDKGAETTSSSTTSHGRQRTLSVHWHRTHICLSTSRCSEQSVQVPRTRLPRFLEVHTRGLERLTISGLGTWDFAVATSALCPSQSPPLLLSRRSSRQQPRKRADRACSTLLPSSATMEMTPSRPSVRKSSNRRQKKMRRSPTISPSIQIQRPSRPRLKLKGRYLRLTSSASLRHRTTGWATQVVLNSPSIRTSRHGPRAPDILPTLVGKIGLLQARM